MVTDSEMRMIERALEDEDLNVISILPESGARDEAGGRFPIRVVVQGDGLPLSTLHDLQKQLRATDVWVDWGGFSVGAELRFSFRERCTDCGEFGQRAGHMTCQYPQDR